MSHGETTRSWLVSGQTSACPSVVNNFAALAHGNLLTSRNHDDETRGRETTWSRAPPLTSLYQSHRSPSVCVRTAQPTPYPLRGINSIAASQHVRERPLPPRLSIPNDPPMVPRRPPRRGNCRETLDDIAKRVPLQVMCPYFNYPLSVAAKVIIEVSVSLSPLSSYMYFFHLATHTSAVVSTSKVTVHNQCWKENGNDGGVRIM